MVHKFILFRAVLFKNFSHLCDNLKKQSSTSACWNNYTNQLKIFYSFLLFIRFTDNVIYATPHPCTTVLCSFWVQIASHN